MENRACASMGSIAVAEQAAAVIDARRPARMMRPRACQIADHKPDCRAAHYRPPQHHSKVQLSCLHSTDYKVLSSFASHAKHATVVIDVLPACPYDASLGLLGR